MFPEGRIVEFVIVGAVALMVVGPKDLPILMRKVGQFVARMRAMAAEFRASFDELARQSELDELRREVEQLRTGRPLDLAATHLGADEVFGDIRDEMGGAHADLTAAAIPSPVAAAAEPPVATPPAEAEPAAAAKSPAAAKPKRTRKAAAS